MKHQLFRLDFLNEKFDFKSGVTTKYATTKLKNDNQTSKISKNVEILEKLIEVLKKYVL